jgi:TatD DNase family protein
MNEWQLKIVDTHCHLEQAEFENDRDVVIQNARKMGISCITSAITPEDWNKCLEIAFQNDNVYASIGLDPILWQASDHLLRYIETHQDQIVSIGEVGLDFYRERDHSLRASQEETFRLAIETAKRLHLPLQVHSRSAGKQALDILSDMDARDVHMHAFDGKASYARTTSYDLGYYFSIPTSVVRSPQKQKLVKAVNIERLLLETDSPVLGPEKGERNEPIKILLALAEVAAILHWNEEEVREIVLENTLRLYSRINIR